MPITLLLFPFLDVYASPTSIHASDIRLTPSGETVAIKLNTGVVVVDTYKVKTNNGYNSPAKDIGLTSGDVITNIDGKEIRTIDDLKNELLTFKRSQKKNMTIKVTRNSRTFSKKITPAITERNTITLGLYLKDNILGIGTITFIAEDGQFAALGHQIKDNIIDSKYLRKPSGIILKAEVSSIKKSHKGTPGEKRAHISDTRMGDINKNEKTGIYGTIDEYNSLAPKLPIATQEDVKIGSAEIWTVINGRQIETFDIQIIGLERQNSKSTKGIRIKVTDPRLLSKTGGIVQGMSGSPIIQNGKIIGAVTHVLVEDTTSGYGIYIEFMLEDLGINVIKD